MGTGSFRTGSTEIACLAQKQDPPTYRSDEGFEDVPSTQCRNGGLNEISVSTRGSFDGVSDLSRRS